MTGEVASSSEPLGESAQRQPLAARDALYIEAARVYGSALTRLARGYEAEPSHRQDLLQVIHVALWRSFETYDHRCSLRTWVYRIAHCAAARHIFANRRLRLHELQTLDSIAEPVDPNDGVAGTDQADELQALFSLIAKLKPVDRQVILLYLEDCSAETIGDVVGLSQRNVATKIHRIKKLLGVMFRSGSKT
jgi:RNA polymerase sigma-70 factor, ECF subfamily